MGEITQADWNEGFGALLGDPAGEFVVRFLADKAGIRQFIGTGTGMPSAGNVHEVAGQVARETHVMYVDNDPIVHAHANALLTGSGTTSIVLADLVDPRRCHWWALRLRRSAGQDLGF